MFTLAELDDAVSLVHEVMPPTPQIAWPLLGRRVGAEVWVKHENHTPIGAFKVRGGLVCLHDLVREGRGTRGLITATRGNHGQSIPFAARRHGIPVTVIVPEGNAAEKNAAMEAVGATLVVHGKDFDEAREEAEARAARDGLEMIPPFNGSLMRGVATYARELFGAVGDLDTVYVPVGQGSGICGVIAVRDLLGLNTDVVAVVAAEAPAYALSWEAGGIVSTNSARTFADGLACRVPHPESLDIIRKGAARVVTVSEDEVAEAMRIYHTDTHNMAEGAGAAPLAALMQEREAMHGRRVAVILTGGNVDREVYAEVLAGKTPRA